jgi:hypothetical protein
MPEPRRLTTEEYHVLIPLFALSIAPPWQRAVLRVLIPTGPGQGAKAAAILWRVLPTEDVERLEAVLIRLQPPGGRAQV